MNEDWRVLVTEVKGIEIVPTRLSLQTEEPQTVIAYMSHVACRNLIRENISCPDETIEIEGKYTKGIFVIDCIKAQSITEDMQEVSIVLRPIVELCL